MSVQDKAQAPLWKIQISSANGWADLKQNDGLDNYIDDHYLTREEAEEEMDWFICLYNHRLDECRVVESTTPQQDDLY